MSSPVASELDSLFLVWLGAVKYQNSGEPPAASTANMQTSQNVMMCSLGGLLIFQCRIVYSPYKKGGRPDTSILCEMPVP